MSKSLNHKQAIKAMLEGHAIMHDIDREPWGDYAMRYFEYYPSIYRHTFIYRHTLFCGFCLVEKKNQDNIIAANGLSSPFWWNYKDFKIAPQKAWKWVYDEGFGANVVEEHMTEKEAEKYFESNDIQNFFRIENSEILKQIETEGDKDD